MRGFALSQSIALQPQCASTLRHCEVLRRGFMCLAEMSAKMAFASIWRRYGTQDCPAYIFSISAAERVMSSVAACGRAAKRRRFNASVTGGTTWSASSATNVHALVCLLRFRTVQAGRSLVDHGLTLTIASAISRWRVETFREEPSALPRIFLRASATVTPTGATSALWRSRPRKGTVRMHFLYHLR